MRHHGHLQDLVKEAGSVSSNLSGLKIRAWDASGTRTLKTAGAAAVQMSWADVVPQLSSGGIEAVLTSAEGRRERKILGTSVPFQCHQLFDVAEHDPC